MKFSKGNHSFPAENFAGWNGPSTLLSPRKYPDAFTISSFSLILFPQDSAKFENECNRIGITISE